MEAKGYVKPWKHAFAQLLVQLYIICVFMCTHISKIKVVEYPPSSSYFLWSILLMAISFNKFALGLVGCHCVYIHTLLFPSVRKKNLLPWNASRDTDRKVPVNSLRPGDDIWGQRSESTLAQVMACCLTSPSHYLNQSWLIICWVLWDSTKANFTDSAQDVN